MKSVFNFYFRHQTLFALVSFVAGFAIGLWRERPIDTDWGLFTQAFTLSVLFVILLFELSWRGGAWTPSSKFQNYWRWNELVSHFMLGGLLRGYAVFFIKSGSTQGSIAFLILIALVMLANELPFVQNRGTTIRSALWALALSCFLTYLVPRLAHRLGPQIFTLSVGLSVVFVLLAFLLMRKRVPGHMSRPLFLWPSLATLAGYLALYHLALIPPVPLMLARFDVAHAVQRDGKDWLLLHDHQTPERLPWTPQHFSYRPGDKAVAAFRLVAPPLFVEELRVRWEYKNADGWQPTDSIPVQISGGRKAGFRGTTTKENLWAGEWRVHLETIDNREIGRLRFNVVADPTEGFRDFEASVF